MRRIGTRRRVEGVTVLVASGPSAVPRVAFVAGRQVGSAVKRNRAKRRLREAMAWVPVESDRDYVVIASEQVVDASFEALVAWLTGACET